jgi:hypothetical protein
MQRLKMRVLGWRKIKNSGENEGDNTMADCGLLDEGEGETKDDGSANLTVYLSL